MGPIDEGLIQQAQVHSASAIYYDNKTFPIIRIPISFQTSTLTPEQKHKKMLTATSNFSKFFSFFAPNVARFGDL